jgi:hypothetical protein
VPAPTFVSYADSGWTTNLANGTTLSVSVTVQPGDIIIAFPGVEAGDAEMSAATGGGLPWTACPPKPNTANDGNFADAFAWWTKAQTPATFNVQSTLTSSLARYCGMGVFVFRDSAGVGSFSGILDGGIVPALDLTTARDDSAVIGFTTEWNSVPITNRVWKTINSITPTSGNGLEKAAASTNPGSFNWTVFLAYWDNAGPAGTKTTGLTTSPDNCKPTMVAVEVLGPDPGTQVTPSVPWLSSAPNPVPTAAPLAAPRVSSDETPAAAAPTDDLPPAPLVVQAPSLARFGGLAIVGGSVRVDPTAADDPPAPPATVATPPARPAAAGQVLTLAGRLDPPADTTSPTPATVAVPAAGTRPAAGRVVALSGTVETVRPVPPVVAAVPAAPPRPATTSLGRSLVDPPPALDTPARPTVVTPLQRPSAAAVSTRWTGADPAATVETPAPPVIVPAAVRPPAPGYLTVLRGPIDTPAAAGTTPTATIVQPALRPAGAGQPSALILAGRGDLTADVTPTPTITPPDPGRAASPKPGVGLVVRGYVETSGRVTPVVVTPASRHPATGPGTVLVLAGRLDPAPAPATPTTPVVTRGMPRRPHHGLILTGRTLIDTPAVLVTAGTVTGTTRTGAHVEVGAGTAAAAGISSRGGTAVLGGIRDQSTTTGTTRTGGGVT